MRRLVDGWIIPVGLLPTEIDDGAAGRQVQARDGSVERGDLQVLPLDACRVSLPGFPRLVGLIERRSIRHAELKRHRVKIEFWSRLRCRRLRLELAEHLLHRCVVLDGIACCRRAVAGRGSQGENRRFQTGPSSLSFGSAAPGGVSRIWHGSTYVSDTSTRREEIETL